MIPFSQGLKLYEAAPEPKVFLEIKGDHNGGFILSGETYRQGLKSFLSDIACIGR